MRKELNFIVVDDSKLDCFIAEKIIKNTGKCNSICSFVRPVEALEHVSKISVDEKSHTILLVDVTMPVMDGFEFAKAFEKLDAKIVSSCSLFLVISTSDTAAIEKYFTEAQKYKSITHVINKPISTNALSALLN